MSFLSKSLTLLLTTTVLNSAYSSSINVINNINDSSFNTPTLNSIKIENGASNNNKTKKQEQYYYNKVFDTNYISVNKEYDEKNNKQSFINAISDIVNLALVNCGIGDTKQLIEYIKQFKIYFDKNTSYFKNKDKKTIKDNITLININIKKIQMVKEETNDISQQVTGYLQKIASTLNTYYDKKFQKNTMDEKQTSLLANYLINKKREKAKEYLEDFVSYSKKKGGITKIEDIIQENITALLEDAVECTKDSQNNIIKESKNNIERELLNNNINQTNYIEKFIRELIHRTVNEVDEIEKNNNGNSNKINRNEIIQNATEKIKSEVNKLIKENNNENSNKINRNEIIQNAMEKIKSEVNELIKENNNKNSNKINGNKIIQSKIKDIISIVNELVNKNNRVKKSEEKDIKIINNKLIGKNLVKANSKEIDQKPVRAKYNKLISIMQIANTNNEIHDYTKYAMKNIKYNYLINLFNKGKRKTCTSEEKLNAPIIDEEQNLTQEKNTKSEEILNNKIKNFELQVHNLANQEYDFLNRSLVKKQEYKKFLKNAKNDEYNVSLETKPNGQIRHLVKHLIESKHLVQNDYMGYSHIQLNDEDEEKTLIGGITKLQNYELISKIISATCTDDRQDIKDEYKKEVYFIIENYLVAPCIDKFFSKNGKYLAKFSDCNGYCNLSAVNTQGYTNNIILYLTMDKNNKLTVELATMFGKTKEGYKDYVHSYNEKLQLRKNIVESKNKINSQKQKKQKVNIQ